jgi:hypothetical protein
MREILTFGLMRGCWKRSEGPLEGDTHPKGEKRPGLARPARHRANALLYSSARLKYKQMQSASTKCWGNV